MYAITHAATALLVKRRYPSAALFPLLVGTQAIELLWVVFVYANIERVDYTAAGVHLGFLPYSHSIGTSVALAAVAWLLLRRTPSSPRFAIAVALAIVSHVILDIVHHEPDIALLPFASSPRIGLGLSRFPLIDLAVAVLYGVACWALFRGRKSLLVAILIFNAMDLPLMFPRPDAIRQLAAHRAILPTVILVQIVLTWTAVWYFGRRRWLAVSG